ncbi:MAG: PilZ domain-containing protein [Desulfamplus sp.]|nr:PilZ domain-containing protein [Desulfamplus sp.]
MQMEDILTNIMINASKLPYEKQQMLLQLTNHWLDQEKSASPSKSAQTPKIEQSAPTTSQPAKPKVEQPKIEQRVEYSDAKFEMVEPQFEPLASPEAISNVDNVFVSIVETRAYERKNFTVPVDFVSSGQLYKEVTKDISAGGLFIKTKKCDRFKKNQKISMVFMLADDKKPFKVTGKIVRIDSDGIGVQFHNLSPFESVAIEEEIINTCT